MNERERVCSKCGSSRSEDNVRLFRFPQPRLRNLYRCELWAQYMCPDGQYSSLKYQKKLFEERYLLCQRHFKDGDFLDHTKTKLLRTAVPTVTEEDSSCQLFV